MFENEFSNLQESERSEDLAELRSVVKLSFVLRQIPELWQELHRHSAVPYSARFYDSNLQEHLCFSSRPFGTGRVA